MTNDNSMLNMPTARTILILEDNDERIAAFQKAVTSLGSGFELKVWRDAHSMMAECERFFASAALICLDHDLNPQPGVTADPGTGLDVARFLADFLPVCPVLIHSSNTDRAYSMQNELRFARWVVDRIGPIGTDWIETTWLRRAREHDLDSCATEARASSLVTHTHPEGVAGTMAVALAAALTWQLQSTPVAERPRRFFDAVLGLTPERRVRRGILLASQMPADIPVELAARALGNGSLVTAPDTVPFCLWIAAHHASNFVIAPAQTIRVGGDCDTNAAIVGGMVALSAGREAIPADWLKAREVVRV